MFETSSIAQQNIYQMTFYQNNHIPRHVTKANYEGANKASRIEGGGRFALSINIPSTLLKMVHTPLNVKKLFKLSQLHETQLSMATQTR